jgi:hypothetical protein
LVRGVGVPPLSACAHKLSDGRDGRTTIVCRLWGRAGSDLSRAAQFPFQAAVRPFSV